MRKGSAHPITILLSEIIDIFSQIGYSVKTGPEVERAYYNFDALNIPKDHPARAMHDTFWIKGAEDTLLRTHTSAMQIKYMENNKPPIKIIIPGKVFRNEATDKTHEVQFHQLEGLCVSEDADMSQLKGTIEHLLKKLFGNDLILRYRPSYFPFTEPSLEVDMRRPGDEKWIEILGCGMVHKKVLSNVGIDPNKYKGFAFGIGIDRIIMLRNNIEDIRSLYKGDLQIVNQFYEKDI